MTGSSQSFRVTPTPSSPSVSELILKILNTYEHLTLHERKIDKLLSTPVLGLGLGVDFTFAGDNHNNHNHNNHNHKNDNNPHLNFVKGTVLGDKEQGIRDKG